MHHERDPGTFLKQRHLAPLEMLAQVVTVIRHEDHHGVFPEPVPVQRLPEQADLGIHKGNTGMVGLHVLTAMIHILHGRFKTKGLVTVVQCQRRNVRPVICRHGIDHQFLPWVLVEVLLRCPERDMRLVDSTGNKKRLVTVCLVIDPAGHLPNVLAIPVLFIGHRGGSKAGRRLAPGPSAMLLVDCPPRLLVLGQIDRTMFLFKSILDRLEDRVPLVLETVVLVPGNVAMIQGPVKDLAHPACPVTLFLEKLGE